jgi:beta-glucanase (GH16 family)
MRKVARLLPILLMGMIMMVACSVNQDIATGNGTDKGTIQANAYDPGTGWTLAWSDEFNTLNTSVWNNEVRSDGAGNSELEAYTASPNNVYIANGALVIKAIKETVNGKPFTSGRLNTFGKYSFRYGKIAARIQCPQGYGMWPAFWLMGKDFDGNNWPYCGEIDILEMAGDGAFMDKVEWSTCHWWHADATYVGYAQYGTQYTNSAALGADYHIYEIEWDTDRKSVV